MSIALEQAFTVLKSKRKGKLLDALRRRKKKTAEEQEARKEKLKEVEESRGKRSLLGQRSAISDDLRTTTDEARQAHQEGSMGGKSVNNLQDKIDFIRDQGVEAGLDEDEAYQSAVSFAFNMNIKGKQMSFPDDHKQWNLPVGKTIDEDTGMPIFTMRHGLHKVNPETAAKEAYYAERGSSEREKWKNTLMRWAKSEGFANQYDTEEDIMHALSIADAGSMSRALYGGQPIKMKKPTDDSGTKKSSMSI